MKKPLHTLGDYYRGLAEHGGIPKPESRKKVRDRERRSASDIIVVERKKTSNRDGYCRLYWSDAKTRETVWGLFGRCRGPSEWAHYNDTHRRSKTVGKPPEERHTSVHSMMLCERHHDDYDLNRIDVREQTPQGCDGRLRFERTKDGESWEEP